MTQLNWQEFSNLVGLSGSEYGAETPLCLYRVWGNKHGDWHWQYSAMYISPLGVISFEREGSPTRSFSLEDAKAECYMHWIVLVGCGGKVVLMGSEP